MATLGPGSWKGAQAQSPDDHRRLRSGFWKHEYRIDSGETVWRCDLHKLHDTVRDILMDQFEHRKFSEDPHRYLDMMFGEGTSKVYFSKHESNRPYVDYRMPSHYHMGMDLARERDATMAYLYNTGTTSTNTTTTSGTADYMMMVQEEMKRKMRNELMVPANNFPPIKKKKDDTFKFRPSLVRNMPFVHGGDSLLKTLQRDFDHWAKEQMGVINAAR